MSSSIPLGSSDSASPDAAAAWTLESLRLAVTKTFVRYQSRVTVETLRPLPVFLGLNPAAGLCLSPTAFTLPVRRFDKNSGEKIHSRLSLNLAFFCTNYVLIVTMTAIIVALMHPGMIFFLAVVYALWMAHAYLLKHPVRIGGENGVTLNNLLTVQQRFYALSAVTFCVVVWKCLSPFFILGTLSSLLVLAHALLRDPSHVESNMFGGSSLMDSDDDDEEGRGGRTSPEEVMVERPST